MSRTNLRVPFAEKDEAKSLGARWDAAAKIWYVPPGTGVEPFERWLPRTVDPTDIGVRAEHYYILESSRACWKCNQSTRLYGFLLPGDHEFLYVEDEPEDDYWERYAIPATVSYVTNLIPEVKEKIKQFGDSYRVNLSEMTASQYWMNHCENCGAKQGDFQLHVEPGGAFHPTDAEAAAQIVFHHVTEPFGCRGDICWGDLAELLWERVTAKTGEERQSERRSLLSKILFRR